MRRLILASSSLRRKELLTEAGYQFEIIPPGPEAEGARFDGEPAEEFVLRMARQKAADVALQLSGSDELEHRGSTTIIGCDTVAVCAGNILGKPAGPQHAREMLLTLRGTEHQAISGLCLWQLPENRVHEQVVTTTLRMAGISDAQLQEYLDSGLWQGKAGGFGLQDRTGWLEIVEGSESNVIGLPIAELAELLRR